MQIMLMNDCYDGMDERLLTYMKYNVVAKALLTAFSLMTIGAQKIFACTNNFSILLLPFDVFHQHYY